MKPILVPCAHEKADSSPEVDTAAGAGVLAVTAAAPFSFLAAGGLATGVGVLTFAFISGEVLRDCGWEIVPTESVLNLPGPSKSLCTGTTYTHQCFRRRASQCDISSFPSLTIIVWDEEAKIWGIGLSSQRQGH